MTKPLNEAVDALQDWLTFGGPNDVKQWPEIADDIVTLMIALDEAQEVALARTVERDVALRELTKWAREAGEAKGKLEMSEAAGMVDNWKEHAIRLQTNMNEQAAEFARQLQGYKHHLDQCEQIAGKALGYPWFKDDQKNFPEATEADGVAIGDHVGDSIVEELANRLDATMGLLKELSVFVRVESPEEAEILARVSAALQQNGRQA